MNGEESHDRPPPPLYCDTLPLRDDVKHKFAENGSFEGKLSFFELHPLLPRS